jgi:hypothetical protein
MTQLLASEPFSAEVPGFFLAIGPGHFPAWGLVSLCPALASGGRVFWVDAGNRFDLYGLSRAARAGGSDPRTVLDHVELARPFTAFQLEKIIASRLTDFSPRPLPMVLSDPMALFYDTDLPQEDAVRLFDIVLGHLRALRVPTLVMAVLRSPMPGRESFSRALRKQAKAVAVLSHTEGVWRLSSFRHNSLLDR